MIVDQMTANALLERHGLHAVKARGHEGQEFDIRCFNDELKGKLVAVSSGGETATHATPIDAAQAEALVKSMHRGALAHSESVARRVAHVVVKLCEIYEGESLDDLHVKVALADNSYDTLSAEMHSPKHLHVAPRREGDGRPRDTDRLQERGR